MCKSHLCVGLIFISAAVGQTNAVDVDCKSSTQLDVAVAAAAAAATPALWLGLCVTDFWPLLNH